MRLPASIFLVLVLAGASVVQHKSKTASSAERFGITPKAEAVVPDATDRDGGVLQVGGCGSRRSVVSGENTTQWQEA
jgi:hypothetical protein